MTAANAPQAGAWPGLRSLPAALALGGLFAATGGLGADAVSILAGVVFAGTGVLSLRVWASTRKLAGSRSQVAAWQTVLLAFYACAWWVRPWMDTAVWSDLVAPFSLISGAWFCAPDRVRDLVDLHRCRQVGSC